jgi:chromosome segregation ATPase
MHATRHLVIVASTLFAVDSLFAEDPARVVVTELPTRHEQQKQLEALNERFKELSEQLDKRKSIIEGKLAVNSSPAARVAKALVDATILNAGSVFLTQYLDEIHGKRVSLAEAIAEKKDVIKDMEKALQQANDFIDGKQPESPTPNPKYRDTKLDDEVDRFLGKASPTATP